MSYVLFASSAFGGAFVQYVRPESQHVRYTVLRDRAHEFSTYAEAEKHARPGEKPLYSPSRSNGKPSR